jgi:hypothetical protein
MTAPWGATPEEWDHFASTLGLEADLLPVVSNPGPRSASRARCATWARRPAATTAGRHEVVGIPKWTQHKATDRDVGALVARQRPRHLPADARRARDRHRHRRPGARGRGARAGRAHGRAAGAPARANSGKCLLAFRMPGEFTKRIIRTADGIIEFLANGQQFIAIGTHPSGARYEWVDGDTGELARPRSPSSRRPSSSACGRRWSTPSRCPTARARCATAWCPRCRACRRPARPGRGLARRERLGPGYERDGKVHVRCPWEDGHSTDSGPSASSYFPAGVGGFAQGHFRCLHASCASRTDGDFLEAVGYGAIEFDVVELYRTLKAPRSRRCRPSRARAAARSRRP